MSAHGFIYQVGETTVIVRNRPKSFEMDANKFDEDDRADAYLSVTDSFVVAPMDKPFVWVPWNEERYPTIEQYYACNRVLIWWIFYMKLKKVQIFCDAGTHRSVTVFGAFLRTYYNKTAEEIVASRVEFNPFPGERDTSTWSHPLGNIDSYLEKYPEDRLLFEAMNRDKLGRLDAHCKYVFDTVRKRYCVTVRPTPEMTFDYDEK